MKGHHAKLANVSIAPSSQNLYAEKYFEFFQVRYLTTLSVSRRYSLDGRVINEAVAGGGVKIGKVK
jgi:hypothetical protein